MHVFSSYITTSIYAGSESDKGEKVQPIKRTIKKDEDGYFVDLGLGRGVDATNPKPWLNKSSFQVREIKPGPDNSNIIGTDEGDLYQAFVNEVETTKHLKTNLSASVPASQLVGVGIDSELSRSHSVSQKSVGIKIVTRTISFRADFDDISKIEDKNIERTQQQGGDGSRIQPDGGNKVLERKTFEERLIDWIAQERRATEQAKASQQNTSAEASQQNTSATASPGVVGSQQDTMASSWDEKIKLIESCADDELYDYCNTFIKTFSITHYVYALELGASHYRVMSEEDYKTEVSNKAKLGVGPMASAAIGAESKFQRRKLKSRITMIGHMEKPKGGGADAKEKVKREAVVGVKLQPISSLVVKSFKLKRELQNALRNFIDSNETVKCKLICACTIYNDYTCNFHHLLYTQLGPSSFPAIESVSF